MDLVLNEFLFAISEQKKSKKKFKTKQISFLQVSKKAIIVMFERNKSFIVPFKFVSALIKALSNGKTNQSSFLIIYYRIFKNNFIFYLVYS